MINKPAMVLLLFLFIASPSFAQDTCNCRDNLAKAIEKVEENYAGFPDKVTAANRNAYNRFKQTLAQKAARLNKPAPCYALLKDYVNYFYDKHFRIEYNAIDSAVIPFDETAFRKKLSSQKTDPLEGIWKDASNTSIAIIRQTDKTYKAIKISAEGDRYPGGFVYFTLTRAGDKYSVKLYNRNINITIPARQVGNLLRIWSLQLWAKEFPGKLSPGEQEILDSWKNNNDGLLFRQLNESFCYLRIPSFENNEGAIQELVLKNDSAIRHTRYLVIDLTGNGGGSSGWVSLLPYVMTNPIIQQESLLRISKDNVARKLPDIEPFVNNPIPAEYKKYFPEETIEKYKKAYRELPVTKEIFYPTPGVNFPLDSITRYPVKTAIMVDDFCGSSTEYFFSLTNQSKKIITYGQHTVGMMDYVGMSVPTPLPYGGFSLYIPIEKSGWTSKKPIDKTGFTPQVQIPAPQEKWLDYILHDLPKR